MNNGLEIFNVEIMASMRYHKTSSLYSLEPIGIGAADIESLTSYINRLSIKHNVSTKDLLSNFIAEKLAINSKRSKNDWVSSALCCSYSFNGTTGISNELVDIIELLTGRNDIAYLTLRNWQNIIPGYKLFKRTKSYCPLCYEEGLLNNYVYDRLLWCFKIVEICPRHNIRLVNRCIYEDCNKELALLGPKTNIGFCNHCNRWLGTKNSNIFMVDELEYLEEQQWITRRISEIIIESTRMSSLIMSSNYTEGLKKIKSEYGDNSCLKTERILGISYRTIEHWCAGENFPCIENLLRICSKLNISLLPLLESGELIESKETINSQTLFMDNKVKSIKARYNYENIQEELEYYANNNEVLHLSVNYIAKILKISPLKLLSKFPDLCNEIDNKRKEYLHSESLRKLESLSEEVKRVVLALYQGGEYPSSYKISKYFSNMSIFKTKRIYDAWVETLVELGLRDEKK